MGAISRGEFRRSLAAGVDLNSPALRRSLARTPAKLSTFEKVDKNRDGKLTGGELDKAFDIVDGYDTNGDRDSIRSRGTPNQIYGALRAGLVKPKAVAPAKPSGPRRTSHPPTDLTKGVPYKHKSATIEVHGANHTKRAMKVVVEQRVGKPGILGQFFGPRYDPKGKVWNGVDNKHYKDIMAGKHAKGVSIKNGKIVVSDPVLAHRLSTLSKVHNYFEKHSGGTIMRDDGRRVRIDVNQKTRQAFGSAALQLIRHGASGATDRKFFESDFRGGIRYSKVFFNVMAEHNAAVNRTVQRSKKWWLRSY